MCPIASCVTYHKERNLVGAVRGRQCKSCAVRSNPRRAKDWHDPGNGYIYRFKDGKRQKYHRHIMELHLGRALTPSEHVHHINGNSLDNRIENLEVLSSRDHHREHVSGDRLKNNGLSCFICKNFKSFDKFHRRNNRPLGYQGTCKECKRIQTLQRKAG